MTPENKATWFKALRSGKFEQCTEALHADGGYCCLGVAIEVLTDLGWEPCDAITDLKNLKQVGGFEGRVYAGTIPEDIANRLGFNDIVPWDVVLKFCPDVISLDEWTWADLATYLNDTCQFTFSEIADVMEEYL